MFEKKASYINYLSIIRHDLALTPGKPYTEREVKRKLLTHTHGHRFTQS